MGLPNSLGNLQRFPVIAFCLARFVQSREDGAHGVQGIALGAAIAELAVKGQRGLGGSERVALAGRFLERNPEAAQADGFLPPVAHLTAEGNRFLRGLLGGAEVTASVQAHGQEAEAGCSLSRKAGGLKVGGGGSQQILVAGIFLALEGLETQVVQRVALTDGVL